MSYLIDDFSVASMHQFVHNVGSSAAVAVGSPFPFSVVNGDSGISVSAGVITLTQGEYYAIGQFAETGGNETLMRITINGAALADIFTQPSRINALASTTSSNLTMMAVFRAQDGYLLEVRNFSTGLRSFYINMTDLVLLRRGNR